MSTISAGTTVGTALVNTGDTTGDLVLKTGSSATTAVTIAGSNQAVTLAQPLAVTSGGTGATTAANARTALGTNDAANITTGVLAVANGGTGLSSPGTSGNVLTSNGTSWTSGAAPAPADGSITDAKIANGLTAGTTYHGLVPYGFQTDGAPASSNLTPTRYWEFRCVRGGTFNFRIRYVTMSSQATERTIIYVNGVSVSTQTTSNSSASSAYTHTHTSVTVNRGDIVGLWIAANTSGNMYPLIVQYGVSQTLAIPAFTNHTMAASSTSYSLPL